MRRWWVVVSLLMLMALTSQVEWKQQLGGDPMAVSTSGIALARSHHSQPDEAFKEKIIISQEKIIQMLNGRIRSLRKQLMECKTENLVANGSAASGATLFGGLD